LCCNRDKIRLVRFEEDDQGGEKLRIAGPAAQFVCPDSGQGEEPLGAPFVGNHRCKSGKSDRYGVSWRLGLHGLPWRDWVGSDLARILIVEDNALNIKLFCDLLAAHGHQPQAVSDSREALDTAREFEPELVITDIQLPHVNGLELIRMLRADEKLGTVPIMAVTAYAGQGDEERVRRAGAEAYVSKPISVVRFVQEVEALLAPREPVLEPADPQSSGD
jgi:two-component system cell cycle response regulator DivK